MKKILWLSSLVIFSVTSLYAQVPDFNLRDCNGTYRHLYADLQAGNAVVLDFCAGWCVPCAEALPFYEQTYQHYCANAGKVKVYGMLIQGLTPGTAADSAFAHEFVNTYHINYPVITPDTALSDSFLALYDTSQAIPMFLMIVPDTSNPANSFAHVIEGYDSSLEQEIADTLALAGFDSLLRPTVQQVGGNLQTQSFATYQWLLNGTILVGDTLQTVAITQNGNYRVIVSSSNGCIDTSSALNITNAGIYDISPMGDVKLFPNPNMGLFTIQFADNLNHTIEITDAVGHVITSLTTAGSKQQFNLNEYVAGIYFVRIIQNNQVKSVKFTLVR